jgi:hypothetical protein
LSSHSSLGDLRRLLGSEERCERDVGELCCELGQLFGAAVADLALDRAPEPADDRLADDLGDVGVRFIPCGTGRSLPATFPTTVGAFAGSARSSDDAVAPVLFSRDGDIEPFAHLLATPAGAWTPGHAPTCSARKPRARPASRPCAA